VATSSDGGKTFASEQPIPGEPGVCACCGLRAFTTNDESLDVFYRAVNGAHRDMREARLTTPDGAGPPGGRSFVLSERETMTCPMSTCTVAYGSKIGQRQAWEDGDGVRYGYLGSKLVAVAPPGEGHGRKHPAIAIDESAALHVCLAWTEGMGWQKGGSVAWQVFDGYYNKPISGASGRLQGVPMWSLVAVFAKPGGGFVVVY
jgi:hypothetical protein